MTCAECDQWKKRAISTEQKLAKAATALREIFEGPPEVWLDWYNRHEAIISELDPDIYCQDFGHPPEKIDVDGKCARCGEKEIHNG